MVREAGSLDPVLASGLGSDAGGGNVSFHCFLAGVSATDIAPLLTPSAVGVGNHIMSRTGLSIA